MSTLRSLGKFALVLSVLTASALTMSCNKFGSGDWLVKIDGDSISKSEFNEIYYAHHKQFFQQMFGMLNVTNEDVDKFAADPATIRRIPTLNKQIFLQEIVNQKLIYEKADNEGFLGKSELQTLVNISRETAVVQYYVRTKFDKDIAVSDQEVEAFYNENRARFKAQPVEAAEKSIRQYLSANKLRRKMAKFVSELRESAQIERSDKADDFLSQGPGQSTEPTEEIQGGAGSAPAQKAGAAKQPQQPNAQ
ncbi:MAG TPA: hypothetical protein PK544_01830 [Spirochaetota bacterium]|nr:hypothetical protein [Spirochaetota bacterium]HPJ36931.1 hypothetical protein [Spirochaetota bacterium]HPQ52503.1 hypothetical protein [Spirochaetota bacterium]